MYTLTLGELENLVTICSDAVELLGSDVTVHVTEKGILLDDCRVQLDDCIDVDVVRDYLLGEVAKKCGILVASDNAGMGQTAWILWFGAYGNTRVLAWGNLQDAVEDAASVLPKGYFVSDESMQDAYAYALAELVAQGEDPEDADTVDSARNRAEVDLTYTESGYLPSWEWGYSIEGVTLADLASMEDK